MRAPFLTALSLRSGMALAATALALPAGLVPETALAQSAPDDVADLVGVRGAGGERQLEMRGYVHVRTETGSDRKWSRWWNAAAARCLTVTTIEGRYAAIALAPPSDCGQPGAVPAASMQADAPAWAASRNEAINLVCYGEGNKPASQTSSALEWDSDTHRYKRVLRTGMGRQDFDAEVTVQIYGSEGRIRPTGKLIPPLHSGGERGWWRLDDLRVTGDAITGQYRLNGLNKPKVKIDRRSGRMTIDGIEDFRGTCDAVDKGTRRF